MMKKLVGFCFMSLCRLLPQKSLNVRNGNTRAFRGSKPQNEKDMEGKEMKGRGRDGNGRTWKGWHMAWKDVDVNVMPSYDK